MGYGATETSGPNPLAEAAYKAFAPPRSPSDSGDEELDAPRLQWADLSLAAPDGRTLLAECGGAAAAGAITAVLGAGRAVAETRGPARRPGARRG